MPNVVICEKERYSPIDNSDITPVSYTHLNPVEMTIVQFAEAINQLTGNTAGIVRQPLPVDDPKQRRPDISKARRVLQGWAPVVPLEQGLAATVADFRRRLGMV